MPRQGEARRTCSQAALFVGLVFVVSVSPGRAQPDTVMGSEQDLRVAWEPNQTPRGTVIAGYVLNASGLTADKVLLRIESLNEAGRAVNTNTGYVMGTVPAFNRTYFEVSVATAISYRVSISSLQWIKGGGGM